MVPISARCSLSGPDLTATGFASILSHRQSSWLRFVVRLVVCPPALCLVVTSLCRSVVFLLARSGTDVPVLSPPPTASQALSHAFPRVSQRDPRRHPRHPVPFDNPPKTVHAICLKAFRAIHSSSSGALFRHLLVSAPRHPFATCVPALPTAASVLLPAVSLPRGGVVFPLPIAVPLPIYPFLPRPPCQRDACARSPPTAASTAHPLAPFPSVYALSQQSSAQSATG